MQAISLTNRTWQRLRDVRLSANDLDAFEPTLSEKLALDLYGPVADPAAKSFVLGQVGQSLDGRIATSSGESRDISSEEGLAHLHRLRALVDAVVIGVKTALHDSPRLTVRLCEGENPARVVIDPSGRLPSDSPVLAENGARRIVIQAQETKRPSGVEVITLKTDHGKFHPADIVAALGDVGLKKLLIEGGGFTIGKFIEHGLMDRLHIAISPLIIGSGQSGLTFEDQDQKLKDAIRPETKSFSLGSEVVFDCVLRAPGRV